MKMMRAQFYFFLVIFFVSLSVIRVSGAGLRRNFYAKTCPAAEKLVRDITWSKAKNDATLGAKLIRLHFHDCFVRGCDASVLLDTVPGGADSEKEARPNLSLGGFEVIDEIKSEVEKLCQKTVSCADILALAARDSVSFPFKTPLWDVLTGRRDGKTSLASEIDANLPSPFNDFTTLMQFFTDKGLNVVDLVALSGAHTLGVSHCGPFARRLYNFTGNGDMDPSLDPVYAEQLKQQCPLPLNPSTTVEMDPRSSLSFDTSYFNILTRRQGLFISDAALLTDRTSARIVRQLQVPRTFFREFAKSMVKMGAIEVLTGNSGEIRTNCRLINA